MRQDERHHTLDDIFVGIDLATRQHQVVVLDGQGHRLTSFKVPHSRHCQVNTRPGTIPG